jgi:hypothetical protein
MFPEIDPVELPLNCTVPVGVGPCCEVTTSAVSVRLDPDAMEDDEGCKFRLGEGYLIASVVPSEVLGP